MNKQDFIKNIAAKADITQKDAGVYFDAMSGVIAEALKKGEKIQLVGFGTFSIKERAARMGINPKTKAKVKIAASKVPAFKFGSDFKKKFN